VQQQGQMIENVTSQNSPFLVNEQKASFEGSPQEEQIELHGSRNTFVAVKPR
jgi:hypothetical protein